MGSPVVSVIRIAANRLPEFFQGTALTSRGDFAHDASVLLRARKTSRGGEANVLAAVGPGLLGRLARPRD